MDRATDSVLQVLDVILLSVSLGNGTTLWLITQSSLGELGFAKVSKIVPSRFQQEQSRCEHGMLVKTIGQNRWWEIARTEDETSSAVLFETSFDAICIDGLSAVSGRVLSKEFQFSND